MALPDLREAIEDAFLGISARFKFKDIETADKNMRTVLAQLVADENKEYPALKVMVSDSKSGAVFKAETPDGQEVISETTDRSEFRSQLVERMLGL